MTRPVEFHAHKTHASTVGIGELCVVVDADAYQPAIRRHLIEHYHARSADGLRHARRSLGGASLKRAGTGPSAMSLTAAPRGGTMAQSSRGTRPRDPLFAPFSPRGQRNQKE